MIVPCHNDGRYLGEALASIREGESVEVVVVDDASTDQATTALLSRLEARGARVVRHEENRGLSEARLTGLRATAAPYVFPLDADDLLVPGVLAAMADVLDADPELAACYGITCSSGPMSVSSVRLIGSSRTASFTGTSIRACRCCGARSSRRWAAGATSTERWATRTGTCG